MHDALVEAGSRGVRIAAFALVLVGGLAGAALAAAAMFEPDWPGVVAGGWRTVAVGAAGGIIGTALLLAVGDRLAARRAWPRIAVEPAPELRSLAEGVSIARGVPVPRVWWLRSAAPNVGCLPGPHGRHLIVTSAAGNGLTRDELEAVMALQLGLLLDPVARRVRRVVVATSLLMLWIVRGAFVALVVVLLRHPTYAGLTVNVVVWVPLLPVLAAYAVRRRVRWSWGVVGDGVAIDTTRHPEPLAMALRRVAGANDRRAPVSDVFGAADVFWLVPVGTTVQSATMVVNGRARRRSSSEMVRDAALLLRARIVELGSLGADPATLVAWRDAAATFDRLSLVAGDTVDDASVSDRSGQGASVHGVVVTPDGARGAPPPVGGWWPPADLDAASQRRMGRPRVPDSAQLAAHDAAVAGRR